jgi:hypothetical protein
VKDFGEQRVSVPRRAEVHLDQPYFPTGADRRILCAVPEAWDMQREWSSRRPSGFSLLALFALLPALVDELQRPRAVRDDPA